VDVDDVEDEYEYDGDCESVGVSVAMLDDSGEVEYIEPIEAERDAG
jgi:hypothetical protein